MAGHPAQDGTRADNQQAAQGSFSPLRGFTQLLPAADECWIGVSTTQAAKSRPRMKVFAVGARFYRATAVTGPTPGMVMSRRAVSSALARWAIS